MKQEHEGKKFEQYDSYVVRLAGASFYQEAIGYIEVGQKCELVPEPDNPHDPKALKVVCGGNPIGYIPKGDNEAFLDCLAAGCDVLAEVKGMGVPDGSKYVGVSLSVTVIWPLDPCEEA